MYMNESKEITAVLIFMSHSSSKIYIHFYPLGIIDLFHIPNIFV
jgi:hypothetical protein